MAESASDIAPAAVAPASGMPVPLVEYDPAELRADLEQLLGELDHIAATQDWVELLGVPTVQSLGTMRRRIAARFAAPFKVVVIGDFNRGKSMLVNAMVGQSLVPVDVTPETVAIIAIGHGKQLEARLCLTDGGRVALRPEQLKREALESILDRFGERAHHVELSAPIETLRDMAWVDTPGAGELFRRFEDTITAYVVEADLVVVVVSPFSPLSASEITFQQQALTPQEFPKLFFVLNMLDRVGHTEDRRRIIGEMHSRLARVFPEAQLFALSAADELARQSGEPRPLPEAAGELEESFARFRNSIASLVALRGEAIQLQRGLDIMQALLDQVIAQIEIIRAGLLAEDRELDRAIAAHQASQARLSEETAEAHLRLQKTTDELAVEAERWLSGFTARLLDEILKQSAGIPAEQLERHLPGFLTESLRAALIACAEAQAPRFEALLNERFADVRAELASITGHPILARIAGDTTFHELHWEHMHIVDFFAERLLFAGGLLVRSLSELLGGREASDKRPLLDRLREGQGYIEASLTTVYRSGCTRLRERVEQKLTQIHTSQTTAIREALDQAHALISAGGARRTDRDNQVAILTSNVERLRGRLAGLREKLAIGGTMTQTLRTSRHN